MKKVFKGSRVEFTFFNKDTKAISKRVGEVIGFEFDVKSKSLWLEVKVPKLNSTEDQFEFIDANMITNVF